jgi:hypothetical protein
MEIQYKEATVSGVTVEDEERGIISALVSVTGIKDRVGDIIEPGCYNRTLKERKPKGVWHHSWTEPVSKTLAAEELMPGDPRLPKQLPDGSPWPSQAGALLIKTQFNLEGARGKQAFSDVKFFGDEQEWSIGYNVPDGGSRTEVKSGNKTRYLLSKPGIDLFEYSPVLFGAMPVARTYSGVKEAQIAYKSIMGTSTDDILAQLAVLTKAAEEAGVDDDDTVIIEAPDPEEDDEDDEFETEFIDTGKAISPATLRKAINALNDLLDEVEDEVDDEDNEKGFNAYVETKAVEYESLTDCVDDVPVPNDIAGKLSKAATEFDGAVDSGDSEAAEKAAGDVMDVLESSDPGDDADAKDALAVVARVMADIMEGTSAEEDVEAADTEKYYHFNCEYKMVSRGTRTNGWPRRTDKGTESRKSQVHAMVVGLDDESLSAMSDYMADMTGERGLKRLVKAELRDRVQTKRERTPQQVAKLGEAGNAFKNGNGEWSYPIENASDLDNAIKAYGRCMPGDKDRLKSYIMKKAKELGAEEKIPDGWREKGLVIDIAELKELGVTIP